MALNTKKIGSDKYQKIIFAATKVFADKGFYNAKVADVAKEAKVADGTIYLYFKNKDDLLISIFEESMDTFIAAVLASIKGTDDPIEKLRRFVQLHLSLVREHQDTAQVLQIELRQSSKFMKEYAGNKFRDYLKIISEILDEGKARGVFRSDLNSAIVKRALFGAIDEIALEWLLMKKKKYTTEEAVVQLESFFIDGLKAS